MSEEMDESECVWGGDEKRMREEIVVVYQKNVRTYLGYRFGYELKPIRR